VYIHAFILWMDFSRCTSGLSESSLPAQVAVTCFVAACIVFGCVSVLHLLIHSPLSGHLLFPVSGCNRIECCSEHLRVRVYSLHLVTWRGVELLAHGLSTCPASVESSIQFSRVVVPAYFTFTIKVWLFQFSPFLPSLILSVFFLLTTLM